MKKSHIKAVFGALGTSVFLLASPVQAAFNWGGGNGSVCTDPCSRSETISGQNINVDVTAYQAVDISSQLRADLTTLRTWDGLAVQASDETAGDVPEHATDNNGKKEGLLFSFDKAVNLTSITMGWHADSDFSLLRYTGNGTPIDTNSTYGNLESNGWELVGNYLWNDNVQTGTDITASIYGDTVADFSGPKDAAGNNKVSAKTSSSYWLVAAMNDAFWDNPVYTSNDYFKLKSFAATYSAPPPGVPEPSTLALMSLSFAAFGFTRSRRRKNLSA